MQTQVKYRYNGIKGNNFLTKWKIKFQIQKSKSEQVFHHMRQHHNEWSYKETQLFNCNFLQIKMQCMLQVFIN